MDRRVVPVRRISAGACLNEALRCLAKEDVLDRLIECARREDRSNAHDSERRYLLVLLRERARSLHKELITKG